MKKKKNITGDLLADACATAEGGKQFFPGFWIESRKVSSSKPRRDGNVFWGAWIQGPQAVRLDARKYLTDRRRRESHCVLIDIHVG
jgi:hypothetical protein